MNNSENAVAEAPDSSETIRPFQFHAEQADLDDLKRRIEATRWPEKEPVDDPSQGVPLAVVKVLAKYWASQYDWRKIEAKINSYPNFITKIDGLDIHFIHVRSQHENALPILITHGWPGSIIEQMKVIDPLTNPTAYGGNAENAFHVVIPSIPGYGFSERPAETGWGPERIAKAWVTLMKNIGYDRFLGQGGDWGGVITDIMAAQSPENVIGIHTNFAGVIPPEVDVAAFRGEPAPSGLSVEEQKTFDELSYTYKNVAYAFIMGSRPQSLYGIADSPVGLAAIMLDHDPRSLALISRFFAGVNEGLTRDDVLDNITLFWLTNTAISACRLYWENKNSFWGIKGVNVPVAVSVFPDELYTAPRSWSEKAYPNLMYYHELNKGGHFAAWEQPEMFTQELRAGFSSLR